MQRIPALACLLLSTLTPMTASAGSFEIELKDIAGASVPDVVVSLVPLTFTPPKAEPPDDVEIAQIGEEYRPFVTPVPVGTEVHFPNRDGVQHHLYSLSKAKPFEKPLYSSGTSESVVFDRPGVVTLGCNIHDWMIAYVVVLETPFFAKSDTTGLARIENLPPGRYRLETWHPRLPTSLNREITIAEEGDTRETAALKLRPDRRIRRAPAGEGKTY